LNLVLRSRLADRARRAGQFTIGVVQRDESAEFGATMVE
jgi:hypothetical protein